VSSCSHIQFLIQYLKEKRQSFENMPEDSCRLFHGRGRIFEGLEHLSIDWFAPMVLVTVFEDKGEIWESELIEALASLITAASGIYVQRRYEARPILVLEKGDAPEPWLAKRGDINIVLSTTQQNIGYFLDIEPARQWLEARCDNARVLNLFSYTCTFSVVAAANGAQGIVNFDLSSKSLNRGRDNHRENGLTSNELHFFAHDIMKSWGKIRKYGAYDLVICDPPSFQKGSFVAARDYPKVMRRLPESVVSGGEILLCLNAPEMPYSEFKSMADEHICDCDFVERLPSNPDFPERDAESALKLLVYKKR